MGFQSNFAKQAAAEQGQTVLNIKDDENGAKAAPQNQTNQQNNQAAPKASVQNQFFKKPASEVASQNPAPNSTSSSTTTGASTPAKAQSSFSAFPNNSNKGSVSTSTQAPPQNKEVKEINKEAKIDEPFNTAKLFKLIEAVGQHMNMTAQEISAVKRKSLAPQEGKKLYVEYTRLLQDIQEKTYAQNQSANGANSNAHNIQGSFGSQNNTQNNQPTEVKNDSGFYEFKYVNNGKVQVMKKSKTQYPEFEYYDGCTVEYVPAESTVFASQSFSKKAKP